MNPDGSNVEQKTINPAIDAHPRWSADGTRIVFTTNRDGNLEIYYLEVAGPARVRLTVDAATDAQAAYSR